MITSYNQTTGLLNGGDNIPARSLEQFHQFFVEAFNAGDIDALMMTFESGASIEPEPGKLVEGKDAIREVLSGFLALKGKISLETTKVVQTGDDIGLLHSQWSLTGTAPDGSEVNLSGNSTEVVRRQPNGTWLCVIDLPNDV